MKTRRRLTGSRFGYLGVITGVVDNTSLSGNDVKAITLGILKKAERDDWLVNKTSKEALEQIKGILGKRGIRGRLAEDWSHMVAKNIIGSSPVAKWTMVANKIDKMRDDEGKVSSDLSEVMDDFGSRGHKSGLLGQIRPRDKVTIIDRFNKKKTGRAVMFGKHGWVLNMGGSHGTPAVANEENIVAINGKKVLVTTGKSVSGMAGRLPPIRVSGNRIKEWSYYYDILPLWSAGVSRLVGRGIEKELGPFIRKAGVGEVYWSDLRALAKEYRTTEQMLSFTCIYLYGLVLEKRGDYVDTTHNEPVFLTKAIKGKMPNIRG